MYTLRAHDTYYLGLFLLIVLTALVVLKLTNPLRYQSIVFFWNQTYSGTILNRPFTIKRAFSLSAFIVRMLVFGVVTRLFYLEKLDAQTFDLESFKWSVGVAVFWSARTLFEGLFVSIFKKKKRLFKLFFRRALLKEKWAFAYGCLILFLVFFSLPSFLSKVIAIGYFIGVITIHLRCLNRYFKGSSINRVIIILYICASEIGPLWLLIKALNF